MAAKVTSQNLKKMLWIILITCTFGKIGFSQRLETETQLIPCKEGWFHFDGKCYAVGGHDKGASWDEASNYCVEQGSNIVSIHSKELHDFLVTFLLLNEKSDTWIGLRYKRKENKRVWADGSALNYLNYTNWEPGEPNGVSYGEECTVMRYLTRHEIGMWNDVPCEWELPFICETAADDVSSSIALTSLHFDPRFCSNEKGGGWKNSESCYHLVKESKSWQNAEKYCQETYGGHHVTMLDETTEMFLSYVFPNTSFWLGIQIPETNEQKWSSGWQVIFNEWDTDSTVDGSCAYYSVPSPEERKKHSWKITTCDVDLPFVCEVSRNKPPAEEDWECPDTSDNWKKTNGKFCYLFETKKLKWGDANKECARKGGSLISIHSKEETAILYKFMKEFRLSFIIGLRESTENDGVFEWADGSEMQYQNWAHGEPSHQEEKCGELLQWTAKWNDFACKFEKEYICSARKTRPKETSTVSPIAIGLTSDLTGRPKETFIMSPTAMALTSDLATPQNLRGIIENIVKSNCINNMSTGTVVGLSMLTQIIMIVTFAGLYICWKYWKKYGIFEHFSRLNSVPWQTSTSKILRTQEDVDCTI